MEQRKVGILGGGNMASAILEGLIQSSALPVSQIQCTDVNPAQREMLAKRFGIHAHEDNRALVAWADVIVLAVKPQIVAAALKPASDVWKNSQLLISICAGVTLEAISKLTGGVPKLVRSMPNTPALVGAGATAIALGSGVSSADATFARELFQLVGTCVELEERYLDAVTGLSGSGPAYVMLFIEALADGGVRSGLTRPVALQLAAQTVLGSAQLLLSQGVHPGQLKDQVTSPAGTTIEGVFALESGGFRAAVMDAVCRATERARALGNG